MSIEIHPLAQRWPLLPEAELASLAECIASDGLDEPITVTQDGRIVDGRNRLNACELAGVTPVFTTVFFADEAEIRRFITRKNALRRNVTTGQKAMAIAENLALAGKRRDGRWVRGTLEKRDTSLIGCHVWRKAMQLAGHVIDFAPALGSDVIAGKISLNDAATQAEARRHEQQAEAREKREAAEQLADLEKNRPDLHDLVQRKELPLADALLLRDTELAKERKIEADRLNWIRKLSWTLVEALSGADTVSHKNNIRDLVVGWRDNPKLRPKEITVADIRAAADQLNEIADLWEKVN